MKWENRVRKEGVGERETKRWKDDGMNTNFKAQSLTKEKWDQEESGGEAPCESEKRGLKD